MSWNDGYERKKFEHAQKAQAKEYRKCGMNEEQIQAMYLHDLQEYRNDRIYAIHTQSIEELESDGEESRNALHKKFLLSMTCTLDMSECERYGWIDEIENNALYCAVCKLNHRSERASDSAVSGWIHAFRSRRPDISHLCCGCFAQALPHTKANPPICCGEWRAEK